MKDDIRYIGRIIKYCTNIEADCERFGDDIETYLEDGSFQRSTDMSLQQIGETVNKLSAELQKEYNKVEWDAVIGFRNIVAHRYEWMDRSRIWKIMHENVPKLKEYCQIILESLSK